MNKRCGTCGSPAIDELSRYCNKCGSPLSPEKSCPGCGKVFTEEESRFCDRCGSPLSLPAIPEVPVTRGKICQVCGFENDEATYFHCKNCGAPLRRRIFGGGSERRLPGGKPIRLIPERQAFRLPENLPEPESELVVPRPISHEIIPGKKMAISRRSVMIGAAVILVLIIIGLLAFAALDPKNAGWGNTGTMSLDNLTKPLAAVASDPGPAETISRLVGQSPDQSPDLAPAENPAPAAVPVRTAQQAPARDPDSPVAPEGPVSPVATPVPAGLGPLNPGLPFTNSASPAPYDPALAI